MQRFNAGQKKICLWILVSISLFSCGVNKKLYQKAIDDITNIQEVRAKVEGELNLCGQTRDALSLNLSLTQGQVDSLLRKADTLLLRINDEKTKNQNLASQKKELERQSQIFQDLLKQFKSMIETGQLEVKYENGRMVVQMGANILFKLGSTTISEDGQVALQKIAEVLKTVPDRIFQIEGHTDNLPIKSARFPSNWELSVMRSVEVVKFLEMEGISGSHLSAAGYSEFHPLDDNSTEEGRSENRRIEIVVLPNLQQLPEINNVRQ